MSSQKQEEVSGMKKAIVDVADEDVPPSPESGCLVNAIFPLRCCFCWVTPYLCRGLCRVPRLRDIPRLPLSNRAETLDKRFDKHWARFKGCCCGFPLALLCCFFWEFVISGFLLLVWTACAVSQPRILQELLQCLLWNVRAKPSDMGSMDEYFSEMDDSSIVSMLLQILPSEIDTPSDLVIPRFDIPELRPWLWLLLLIFLTWLSDFAFQLSYYLSMVVGLRARTLITTQMHHKVLRLRECSSSLNTGTILSQVQTDAPRIEGAIQMLHFGWTGVALIAVAVYFLSDLVGWAAPAGFGGYVAIVPGAIISMVFVGIFKGLQVRRTDARVRQTTELVRGVRVVKMLGWEEVFVGRILGTRRVEVCLYRAISVAFGFLFALVTNSAVWVAVLAYVVLYFVDGALDPIKIFASMAFFSILTMPLMFVPSTLGGLIDILVSLGRIGTFLGAEEMEGNGKEKEEVVGEEDGGEEMEKGVAVEFVGASFSWGESEEEKGEKETGKKKKVKKDDMPKEVELKDVSAGDEVEKDQDQDQDRFSGLHDLDLQIRTNELVFVIGGVGSGKSSLLGAALGELKKLSGTVRLSSRSIAYCSQTPFCLSMSVVDNVTYGREKDEAVDEDRFSEIVRVCCLGPDLEQLTGGRDAIVGELGTTLSGGQKYRLQLAQACYSDCQIVFLDDPLGAVDSHVGRTILEECICGFLANRTRVVVTNQLDFLDRADRIVMMEKGRIVETGTFDDLMKTQGPVYDLVQHFSSQKDKDAKEEYEKTETDSEKKEDKDEEAQELMEKEEIAEGAVSCNVYCAYVRAMDACFSTRGILPCALMILGLFVAQLAISSSSWFLAEWADGTFTEQWGNEYTAFFYFNALNDPNMTNLTTYDPGNSSACPVFFPHVCINMTLPVNWDSSWDNGTLLEEGITQLESVGIYGGIAIAVLILAFFREVCVFNSLLSASHRLHNNSLKRIVKAPLSFFDTTPLGRVISRFATDVGEMDFLLPTMVSMFLGMLFNSLGSGILMSYSTWGIFLVVLVPCSLAYVALYCIFRKSAIEWKRWNAVTRSGMLTDFSATLSGASTIRAYGWEDSFVHRIRKSVNVNNRAFYLVWAAERWLGIHFGVLNTCVVGSIGVIAVVLGLYAPESWAIPFSYLALAISLSFSSTAMLGEVARTAARVEVQFNSVERSHHYGTAIENEQDVLTEPEGGVPIREWCVERENASIVFRNFSMRYRQGLPLVLKDLSFEIRPGEKIGVVGRTGSGKSSLLLAVLRLVEGDSGKILLGGVPADSIPLGLLRSNIAMIPQQPLLFSSLGTLRKNLDPRNEVPDDELWKVLERCRMKVRVEESGGLDTVIEDGGKNFSTGERQLLCMARALIRNADILLLDEVTASVDMATDELIQSTLRSDVFASATILMIAHRLNSIIDADRVLVMDDGLVGEFDTPKNLLSEPKYGLFRELIAETGRGNARRLSAIALGEEIHVEDVDASMEVEEEGEEEEDYEEEEEYEEGEYSEEGEEESSSS